MFCLFRYHSRPLVCVLVGTTRIEQRLVEVYKHGDDGENNILIFVALSLVMNGIKFALIFSF